MKLLDKLKDALFEEEEVEIDERELKEKEKPKKKKEKKEKTDNSRLSKVKITSYEEEEEKPVAKKIVSEPPKPEKEEHKEPPAFSFPMVDDSEFTDESYGLKVTELEEVKEKKEKPKKKSKKKEEPVLYQSAKEDYVKHADSEYGGYGKGRERKVFKPSPNISPVYGIIGDDSNYSSEIPEREVRLTSALRSDKMNLDDVRKKAYGETIEEPVKEELEIEESIDLREDAPKVNKVTMGDAEEYFQDLGLEYNNDYIDIKKEKENGKLEDTEKEDVNEELPAFLQENNEEKEEVVKEEEKEEKKEEEDKDLDDDNLFDLIDSMYDK